jgi:hypothetical protein
MASALRTPPVILRASLDRLSRRRGLQPVGLYIAEIAARCGCDAATVAGMVCDATATERAPSAVTEDTASPDTIPSCKLTVRRADSRCVARSLPRQRTQKCQRRPRGAPHEHPAVPGKIARSDSQQFPHLRPVSQEPISCLGNARARA